MGAALCEFPPGTRFPDAPLVLVPDLIQIESVRGSGDAGLTPIPGGENGGNGVAGQTPLADFHKGSCHDPDLVHEEPVPFEYQIQAWAFADHGNLENLPERAFGSTFLMAEA